MKAILFLEVPHGPDSNAIDGDHREMKIKQMIGTRSLYIREAQPTSHTGPASAREEIRTRQNRACGGGK